MSGTGVSLNDIFAELEKRRQAHLDHWKDRLFNATSDEERQRLGRQADQEWASIEAQYGSAARLRIARAEAGYASVAAAARAHDFHKQNLADHEAGRRRIQPEQANSYALAFNVSPSYILFGKEHSSIEPVRLESRLVHVVGKIRDTLESADSVPDYLLQIPVKIVGFDRVKLVAFYVETRTYEYPSGTYLIVASKEDAGVRRGDHLVIEIKEGQYRRFQIRSAEYRDRYRQGPHEPPPLRADEVRIAGVVIQSIQPRPQSVGALIGDSNLLLT